MLARKPSQRELGVAAGLGISGDQLARMQRMPLYRFSERELDSYLSYLHQVQPDPRLRLQHLARKMIGQRY